MTSVSLGGDFFRDSQANLGNVMFWESGWCMHLINYGASNWEDLGGNDGSILFLIITDYGIIGF